MANSMVAATIIDGAVEPMERPVPRPEGGEVLVRVRAAGLNNADIAQVAGRYPAPPGAPPDVPGIELAGEVVAAGPGASRFRVGDRVMSLVGGGAHAEYVVVHERVAMAVPDDVGWSAAGGFAEAFTTAHDALITRGRLEVGERVCIHGAAGGVGSAAVQLAHIAGTRVTAVVRDPARRHDVEELGATVVAPDDFAEAGPFDLIIELVGASNLAADVGALADGGRIVIVGVASGGRVGELDLRALMSCGGRIQGTRLRVRPLEQKAAAARAVEATVVPLLCTGRVRVPVHATHPLASVAEAYAAFARPGKFGKLLLTMG